MDGKRNRICQLLDFAYGYIENERRFAWLKFRDTQLQRNLVGSKNVKNNRRAATRIQKVHGSSLRQWQLTTRTWLAVENELGRALEGTESLKDNVVHSGSQESACNETNKHNN